MIEILGLILGALIGVATSAAFIIHSKVQISQKILQHSIPLVIVIFTCFVIVLNQKSKLEFVESNLNKSEQENMVNEQLIKSLKEKLLLNTQLSNLYDVVLDTEQMPAVIYEGDESNKLANRRMITKDNAFYVAFVKYFDKQNEGATFQLNYPGEAGKREDWEPIDISRYSILRKPIGDYIYNFSIPDSINPQSGKISLHVTKEINVEKYMNVLLSK